MRISGWSSGVCSSDLGELVPRTDRKAIVAAIDAVADPAPQVQRDRPGMLDRQIGYAAPRIEAIGRGKGLRRAGVLAGAAAAAAVAPRPARNQIERRVDRAEKQPTALIASHHVRMLALPAEPGGGGERFFHHRRGVDEHLDLRSEEHTSE